MEVDTKQDNEAELNEKSRSNLEKCRNSCYICLDAKQKVLVKIGQKFHERLNELGLAIVKTSVSSNSLCMSCYNDVQTSLDTIDQIQKANLFWRTVFTKAGYCIEKSQLPPVMSIGKNGDNNGADLYKCLRCDLNFMTKTCLNHHTWKDHLRLNEDPSRCAFCNKKYQHEKNCRKHVFLCHEDEKTHLCSVCGKSGMNRATLRLHCLSKHDGVGWNNGTTWYTCEVCKGIRFYTKENYHAHMQEHHGLKSVDEENQIEVFGGTENDENYESDIDWVPSPAYEVMYKDEVEIDDSLKQNIIEIEVEEISTPKDLQVQQPDENLLDEPNISEEMEQVEYLEDEFDEIPETKTQNTKTEFTDTNTGIESYQCPQCNEWFSRYFFYLHIWEHFRNAETPSVCKFCDKELKTEESCRRHFLFKHFEKFQVCDVCGKRDMTQLELFHHKRAKHIEVHKEEIESRRTERQASRDRRYKLMSLAELKTLEVENDIACEEPVTVLDCPDCGQKFKGAHQNVTTAQHKHIWEVHKRLLDRTQCPDCEKNFEEEFLAKKHYFFMHFEPNYSCDNCKKSGMTYKQLSTHLLHELKLIRAGISVKDWDGGKSVIKKKIRSKYNDHDLKKEKRKCPVCDEKFFGTNSTTTSAYLKHAWDVHGKGPDPKYCRKCNKSFDTEFYARKHYLHLHWDHTFTCEYCSLSNLTKMQLYHHRIIVHENANKMAKNRRPELNCPFCCQKFKDPVKFEKHKQNHKDTADQPKLICETCKKGYSNIHSLKEHQLRAHIKVFSHHCRYCDRGFYSSGSRNTHEISIHTKMYPFKCRFCGLETTQMANLKLHIRRIHDIKNDAQVVDAIIRQVSRKKRTKEEVEAQKVYVQHAMVKENDD